MTPTTKKRIFMHKQWILPGLVAIIMVTCAFPFMASEDSDALTGNSNLSLDKSSAVIYVTGGDNSATFSLDSSTVPSGTSASRLRWKLNDIGDGNNLVSFSPTNGNTYTTTGYQATVYSKTGTGSIEVEVYIAGTTNYYASAVIVVFQSPGTPAETFHFFFQIKEDAYTHVQANNSANVNLPSGYTMAQFYTGFWVSVTKAQADPNNNGFTALSALQWYLTTNGWSNSFGSYGWINQLLGLGTYSGDGGVWYYWAQYHAVGNGWAFNNTTLGFITTVDQSYIGMIFWGSPDANTMPTPFPGIPV
ncbi:hypothetical protein PAA26_02970 [Methanomassiliicoccaceae archaeon COG_1]|nr:hypothetical protein [Methanomassiliicoccaceae archaeon COG_1]